MVGKTPDDRAKIVSDIMKKYGFSAMSIEDAIKYNTKNIFKRATWKSLSQDQRDAIIDYTGDAYVDMNLLLRRGESAIFDYKSKELAIKKASDGIEKCTSAISKFVTEEDIYSIRGVKPEAIYSMLNLSPEDLSDIKKISALKGQTFMDKGFYSSSASAPTHFGKVNIHTMVPKGSKAIYVNPISKHPDENELILQRNSVFKITDIVLDSLGEIKDVVVELVDQRA